MAGLESIALAVAHLERAREAETASAASSDAHVRTSDDTSSSEGNPSFLAVVGTSPAVAVNGTSPATGSIPSRQPFCDFSARLVSSDSIRSKDLQDPGASDAGFHVQDHPCRSIPVVSPPSSRTQTVSSSPSIMDPTTASPDDLAADLMSSPQQLPPPPPPTEAITQVLEDDVLCGRGGETNHHSGNIKYRSLVKCYQPLYIVSKRRDKPRIAQKIVFTIRQRGGRFLKKDARSNTWRDVGNTKAREKTSQALREGAPDLRHGSEAEGDSSPSPPTVPSSVPPESLMMRHAAATNTSVNSMGSMAHMPSFQFHRQQAAKSVAAMGLTPAAAAALFLTSSRPSLVEASGAGDFDHASNLKRRLDSLSGLPIHAVHHHHPQASLLERITAPMGVSSSPMIHPSESFAATVSADDEDVATTPQKRPEASRMRGGPRLKRLKSRLESSA